MKRLTIMNQTRATLLADKAVIAEPLRKRIIGLLGQKGLGEGEALVIRPCSAIHTFFMRFPIDVIFLDRASRVVKTIQDMQPYRLSGWVFGAKEVIELSSGIISATHTKVGDLIEIQP